MSSVLMILSVLDPSDSLSVFPLSVFLLTFGIDIDSFTVLFALVPVTNVFSAIGPLESTLALLHVIDVLAYVLSAIWPGESTMTFHLVVLPVTSVDSAISPLIDTTSMNVVIEEVSSESALVCPCELASAMFLSLRVLSIV